MSFSVSIENSVSKHLLEHIVPSFEWYVTRKNWGTVITRIVACVHACFYCLWTCHFKMGLKTANQWDFKVDSIKLQAFPRSAQAAELRRLFPYNCLWNQNAAWLKNSWFKMGTCFGQSLTVMKHGTPDIKPFEKEVLFLQAAQLIQAQLEAVLKAKKQMQSKHISTRDLASKKDKEAWLFHYLRKSACSRAEARFFTEQYLELFELPLREIQEAVGSFVDIYRDATSKELDFQVYDGDSDARDFLLHNEGAFILSGFGNMSGHTLFLEIEEGYCTTYDSASKMYFTVPHTADGIGKTLELMKKIVAFPGTKTHYQIAVIDS